MPIHKLANGPITMVIRSIETAEGNFGPQMVFKGNTDDVVYISETSGSRGLARLNLTPETAAGVTLTLAQIKKDGKTFTNIDIAGANAPVGAAAPVAAAPVAAAPVAAAPVAAAPGRAPSVGAMTLDQAVPLYAECVEAAIATLGKACVAAGIMVESAAIQAAAATLFIRVSK